MTVKYETTFNEGMIEVTIWVDSVTLEITDSSMCDWQGNEVVNRKAFEEMAYEQYLKMAGHL